jgi:hypothetical protein
VIKSELQKLEMPRFIFNDYQLVIELPCAAVDADSYDLLDAALNDENVDPDLKQGFMVMRNTHIVNVGALRDGSILILVKKEDMDSLNFFINQKSNEIYLYLNERDGYKEGINFGDAKFKFNYLDSLQDIYRRVQEYTNLCDPGRNLKIDHI